MLQRALLVVSLGLLSCLAAAAKAANTQVTSFQRAKRMLAEVYAEHRITLYSGCPFDAALKVDYGACDYEPRGHGKRAHRIEWEHVVPAEAFGRSFAAWTHGDAACLDRRGRSFRGRHCAAKVSVPYRLIEADLYNLYPEIGEINALRSNHPMAELPEHGFFLPHLRVKASHDRFEPRPEAKGDVARTYLYMDTAYPAVQLLGAQERRLYESWSAADPVDAWECARASRIARLAGHENPVLQPLCAAANLQPKGE